MRAFERYLTEAEQQVLLRHMHLRRADALALRDGALMRLLLHTGMRLGETLALTQAEALQALRSGWLFIPREHRKGKRADQSSTAISRGLIEADRRYQRQIKPFRGHPRQ